MSAFTKILCPLDFSEESVRALEHASRIARWYDGTVTVFHAHDEEEPNQQTAAGLEASAQAVRTDGARVTTQLAKGAAAQSILDAARALGADLIVMGTHGRGGWDRLVLGSVTEKVLRKASCPVLTIPPAAAQEPNIARPLGYERVVCPLDFFEWSMTGLKYAASLANEANALLIALHVIDGLHAEQLTAYPNFDVIRYMQHLQDDARARLHEAIPKSASGRAIEEMVTTGKPHEEIVRVARERDAHLIVIGVHGRPAIDLMLLGSTAHHVIRTASCPVLTLRQ